MRPIIFRCARCGIHLVKDPAGLCSICTGVVDMESRALCILSDESPLEVV